MKPVISNEMKRFNHLLGEIEAEYHNMSLKLGLSDSAMGILYTICDNGESCPLQKICRCTGLSKQTINSAIRKLESENVIYLEPAGTKNKTVFLTENGKLLAQKTAMRILEIENDILASWSGRDVEKYLELTEKFLTSLKEKADTL